VKKTSDEGQIIKSSGNVYADFGHAAPNEALAKSELARRITNAIQARKLSQRQAAVLMGIDQPKLSRLARGQLDGYSLDRLMRYCNALGLDVEIRVSAEPARNHTAQIIVAP